MTGFPSIGEQIGTYCVTAELGRGGMGIVYRATQSGLNRPVALKILDPRLASDQSFVQRFSREASILASLDSPHVIQIFDHGTVDGYYIIAMQYVSGGDLSQLIGRTGPLPPATALEIFRQIIEALGDAHARGIVHRDVKPSNVLLRPETVDPFAYLCDFGIAQTGDGGLTRAGDVVGSQAFMSPERHSGASATPQSDFYSAACVLWSMLTSRNVYSGTDLQVAMAHLTLPVPQLRGADPLISELNRILRTCLAKDPAERPDDAAEVLSIMRRAVVLAGGVAPLDIANPDSGIFRPLRPASSAALLSAVPEGSAPGEPGERPRRAPSRGLRIGVAAASLVAVLTVALVALNWTGTIGGASPVVTATPRPTTSFTCWNAAVVPDAANCPTPTGTAALRYLYPSLDTRWDSCVYKAYRKTTDAFDCSYGKRGLIRYRYWQDAAEATALFQERYLGETHADFLLDGEVVGTRHVSVGKQDGDYSQSVLWFDAHFSFTIEAPTKAYRDELLELVRIRGHSDLLGHPTDREPTQGVPG